MVVVIVLSRAPTEAQLRAIARILAALARIPESQVKIIIITAKRDGASQVQATFDGNGNAVGGGVNNAVQTLRSNPSYLSQQGNVKSKELCSLETYANVCFVLFYFILDPSLPTVTSASIQEQSSATAVPLVAIIVPCVVGALAIGAVLLLLLIRHRKRSQALDGADVAMSGSHNPAFGQEIQ